MNPMEQPDPDCMRDVMAMVEALDNADDRAVQVIMENADTSGCMRLACSFVAAFLQGMRDKDPDVLEKFTRQMRGDFG